LRRTRASSVDAQFVNLRQSFSSTARKGLMTKYVTLSACRSVRTFVLATHPRTCARGWWHCFFGGRRGIEEILSAGAVPRRSRLSSASRAVCLRFRAVAPPLLHLPQFCIPQQREWLESAGIGPAFSLFCSCRSFLEQLW